MKQSRAKDCSLALRSNGEDCNVHTTFSTCPGYPMAGSKTFLLSLVFFLVQKCLKQMSEDCAETCWHGAFAAAEAVPCAVGCRDVCEGSAWGCRLRYLHRAEGDRCFAHAIF